MTVMQARRWLVWIALAFGIGGGVVGTPARHASTVPPAHSTVIRGC